MNFSLCAYFHNDFLTLHGGKLGMIVVGLTLIYLAIARI